MSEQLRIFQKVRRRNRESGKMQEPGMKKLTMEDVARELGVSKTTVSRSVSGKGRIGKKTRERVLNYIEQHKNQAAEESLEHKSDTLVPDGQPVREQVSASPAHSGQVQAAAAQMQVPDISGEALAAQPGQVQAAAAGEQVPGLSSEALAALVQSGQNQAAQGVTGQAAQGQVSDIAGEVLAALVQSGQNQAVREQKPGSPAHSGQSLSGYEAAWHAKPKQTVQKSAERRRRSKSGTCNIGVVLPADLFASDRPYFPKALKGISEIADSEDYDVIMILVDTNDLSRLTRVIEKRKADGLILIRTLQDEKPMEMLKNSGIPFAAVGISDDPEIYQADNDYEEACYELTNILLMKGVKKIAAVAGNMNYVINKKRMEGFYKAHRARGITPDKSLIFTDVLSPLSAARAADTILMRGAHCIIGADDFLTSHVLRELEEKHVRIPQEMKLASFHDSQLLASAKTGITAIQFHTEELGREACRMLLHQIRGEEVPRLTKLSYEVTLRESTK